MYKLGFLTGILVLFVGLLESNQIIFYAGIVLMGLCMIGDLFRGTFQWMWEKYRRSRRMKRLEKFRKKHDDAFHAANDWLTRFAKAYPHLLPAPFFKAHNGKLIDMPIEGEREDTIINEFSSFLIHKGITIPLDWLCIEINDRIINERMDRLHSIVQDKFETSPTLDQLLYMFVEERSRLVSMKKELKFWDRIVLYQYMDKHVHSLKLQRSFPSIWRKRIKHIEQQLQRLEKQYGTMQKMQWMEEWLLQGQQEETPILQLNHSDMKLSSFRELVLNLFEKIGFQILAQNQSIGMDLIIERSGIQYGVMIKTLNQNEAISVHTIQEANTIRTITRLPSMIIITNQRFTEEALSLANRLGIICTDRDKLSHWLELVNQFHVQALA